MVNVELFNIAIDYIESRFNQFNNSIHYAPRIPADPLTCSVGLRSATKLETQAKATAKATAKAKAEAKAKATAKAQAMAKAKAKAKVKAQGQGQAQCKG